MKILWKNIRGWGGSPVVKAAVSQPETIAAVQQVVKKNWGILARGGGNSYGDSSLNGHVISTRKLTRILREGEAEIEIEAGVTIEQLLKHLLPRRRFLAVTPGTKAVTIGGAIASDVHGKNHATAGSFFNITRSLMLVDGNGNLFRCSRQENTTLFYNCFGGMGLSGIVVSACIEIIHLPACFILERQFVATSLPHLLRQMEEFRDAPYLVSWINLLSKDFEGIVKTGEWDTSRQSALLPSSKALRLPFRFPVAPPRFLFRWYNHRYFTKAIQQPVHSVPLYSFFYPLDSIRNWRYAFGPKGLLQYHFRLPYAVSETGILEILQKVKSSKAICTLAVLKRFGKGNEKTPHSFAKEGYNLALDFIDNEAAIQLIHQLDVVVGIYGGAIYKTKDAVSMLPEAVETNVFQSVQNQRYAATHYRR